MELSDHLHVDEMTCLNFVDRHAPSRLKWHEGGAHFDRRLPGGSWGHQLIEAREEGTGNAVLYHSHSDEQRCCRRRALGSAVCDTDVFVDNRADDLQYEGLAGVVKCACFVRIGDPAWPPATGVAARAGYGHRSSVAQQFVHTGCAVRLRSREGVGAIGSVGRKAVCQAWMLAGDRSYKDPGLRGSEGGSEPDAVEDCRTAHDCPIFRGG